MDMATARDASPGVKGEGNRTSSRARPAHGTTAGSVDWDWSIECGPGKRDYRRSLTR